MSRHRLESVFSVTRMAVVAIAAMLGSCAEGTGDYSPGLLPGASSGNIKAYRLGIGDKVRLTVFGEPEMSGTHEINSLGRISLPLAGDIQAAGMDATGLKEAVSRKYADGYLKNPKITLEVIGFRPVYVHGEVRSGGEFPFKTGLRFRDAIALAGGYSYRANQSYVVLSRVGAAPEVRVPIASEMIVMPGDNIRVPERFF